MTLVCLAPRGVMASDKTEEKNSLGKTMVVFGLYFSRRHVAKILPFKMARMRNSPKYDVT